MALTASSLCMGRRSSCGQRSDSPTPKASRSSSVNLFRRAAVNLHLGLFVQGAFWSAFGVEPDKAGLYALSIDEPAFVSLEIFAVGTNTQAGNVELVIIIKVAHVLVNTLVIDDLDHNGMINFGGIMGMPDDQGEDFLGTAEIELDPLAAFAQINNALFTGFFVAVGEFGQGIGRAVLVAAGDLGAWCKVLKPIRDHHRCPRLVREGLDKGAELGVFGGGFKRRSGGL